MAWLKRNRKKRTRKEQEKNRKKKNQKKEKRTISHRLELRKKRNDSSNLLRSCLNGCFISAVNLMIFYIYLKNQKRSKKKSKISSDCPR